MNAVGYRGDRYTDRACVFFGCMTRDPKWAMITKMELCIGAAGHVAFAVREAMDMKMVF